MDDKAHTERLDTKDLVLELNFVPQWARKPPGRDHYASAEGEPQRDDRRRSSSSRERERPRGRPPVDRARRPRDASEERAPRVERPAFEPIRNLPIQVSFLPEQKRLGLLARQVHHSNRAYPLIGLANLLIQDEDGYTVKIEVNSNANDFSLYQCRCCKAVAVSEEMMIQHLFSKHLADFYEKEEIETDPPAGQFICVARCRKSGIIVGPPNHHSYNDRLAELHQTRFSNISLEEYKRSIETVHDEALIEQWKEESRHKTVYRLREQPDAEPMPLNQAEAEFRRRIPELYESVRRAVIPARIARQLEDRDLIRAIGVVWTKENRFPLSMSFAMRTAFRHMHLHVFKAGKVNFVTHVKPHFVAPEKTVDNIAEVLEYLKEHPGSLRADLLTGLYPTLDPATPEAQTALQPLSWLIERGHIIEFFDGTLSVPLRRRR